jgi:hypothetical protein
LDREAVTSSSVPQFEIHTTSYIELEARETIAENFIGVVTLSLSLAPSTGCFEPPMFISLRENRDHLPCDNISPFPMSGRIAFVWAWQHFRQWLQVTDCPAPVGIGADDPSGTWVFGKDSCRCYREGLVPPHYDG